MTYDAEEFAADLDGCLGELRAMLVEKNRQYGNSALDPVRIFSKAPADEQLLVRIDDKISRLRSGDDAGEDVIHDLLGYLVLYRIAQKRKPVRFGEEGWRLTFEPVPFQSVPVQAFQSVPPPPFVGPFVGKRVALVLDEKEGVVTVDDGKDVVVSVGDSDMSYPLRMFKSGLKEKWIVWIEEEKKNADQEEEAKQEDDGGAAGGSAPGTG